MKKVEDFVLDHKAWKDKEPRLLAVLSEVTRKGENYEDDEFDITHKTTVEVDADEPRGLLFKRTCRDNIEDDEEISDSFYLKMDEAKALVEFIKSLED